MIIATVIGAAWLAFSLLAVGLAYSAATGDAGLARMMADNDHAPVVEHEEHPEAA